MNPTDWSNLIQQFGPWFGVLVVFAVIGLRVLTMISAMTRQNIAQYAELHRQTATVVANNTRALSELCTKTNDTADFFKSHDERAQRIEIGVAKNEQALGRIETQIENLPAKISAANRPV